MYTLPSGQSFKIGMSLSVQNSGHFFCPLPLHWPLGLLSLYMPVSLGIFSQLILVFQVLWTQASLDFKASYFVGLFSYVKVLKFGMSYVR